MKFLLSLFLFFSAAFVSASESIDPPLFVNGKLNPLYEKPVTTPKVKVVEILKIISTSKAYKLDFEDPNVKDVWAFGYLKVDGKQIVVGDELIFKGFVGKTRGMPGDVLIKKIKDESFLLATEVMRDGT